MQVVNCRSNVKCNITQINNYEMQNTSDVLGEMKWTWDILLSFF